MGFKLPKSLFHSKKNNDWNGGPVLTSGIRKPWKPQISRMLIVIKVTFHIWLMRRKNYYNPTKKAQTSGNHCCFRFSFQTTDWFPLCNTWHFLQGQEGYSRHPRFDRSVVGDLGKRKISWRDMEFARYSGCGIPCSLLPVPCYLVTLLLCWVFQKRQ